MSQAPRAPISVDPSLALAARAIVDGSLGVVAGERVVIVTDATYRAVSDALVAATIVQGAHAATYTLDGARPYPRLPSAVTELLEGAQASVLIMENRADEAQIRRDFIDAAGRRALRHAHLIGISRTALQQGFLVDARRILEATRKIRVRITPSSTMSVRSNVGTKLDVKLDPAMRWGQSVGKIASGQWENLPGGQLFTCPADVRGVFVADASVTGDMGRAYAVGSTPVSFDIEGGVCKKVRCSDLRVAGEIERRLRSADHLTRVGQVILGTNTGLSAPIGDTIYDCCVPGLHLLFGYTAPEDTGARWCAKIGITANQARADVDIDGVAVIRQGRFVV